MIRLISLLADTRIFFFSTIWLMILLFVGTLDQVNIGLIGAQQKYFSSLYFLAFNFIPLPSAYPVIGLIMIGLTTKIIFKTHWRRGNLGINITHTGSLLLIIGAGITAFNSTEGSMTLYEGETSSYFSEHHKLEFSINSRSSKENSVNFEQDKIFNQSILNHEGLKIEIINFYPNSKLVKREPKNLPEHVENNNQGFLKRYNIVEIETHLDLENNEPGAIIKVTGSDVDGLYLLHINQTKPDIIKSKSTEWFIELRYKKIELPFSLKLIDFEKINYPGTDSAKNYRSKVLLIDGELQQKTLIEMNSPLRYKGYTFFQTSYAESDNKEITVLTVVKNYGRLFPYISSIIICFGLFIHILLIFYKHSKKDFEKINA